MNINIRTNYSNFNNPQQTYTENASTPYAPANQPVYAMNTPPANFSNMTTAMPPLAPAPMPSPLAKAASANFPTLLSLLNKTNLTQPVLDLEKKGKLLVFAPTEQAFKKLEAKLPGITAALQKNPAILAEILKYHVSTNSSDIDLHKKRQPIDSLTDKDGIRYTPDKGNGQGIIKNGDQRVKTAKPLILSPGVTVVPIDDVLIPPGLDPAKLLKGDMSSNPDACSYQ